MTDGAPDALSFTDDAGARRFEALTPSGELAGYAEYRRGPERIAFTHTVTQPGWEGHGVATRLIRHALDDSRRRGLKVTAICPFVRSFVARHADYQDLLAAPLPAQR